MKKIRFIFVFVCFAILPKLALADTITGEIVFDKRPAKAGVFYELKDKFDQVNGTIKQKDKQFTEMIGVASHLGKLELLNNDTFEHNIFANDIKNNVKFDIGLMSPGSKQEIAADWQTNTIVRIGCKIHPKMRSYIANIPSDNFISFEFEKKQTKAPFKLEKVAASTGSFFLLLAGMDITQVDLALGETKTFDILKKGKKNGTLTITRS